MSDIQVITPREIFLGWEKRLRPAYNVILAGIAALVIMVFSAMGYPVPPYGRTIFHFGSRAVAANLLFTAGPFAAYYISTLIGRRSTLVTGFLFTCGTLLSVMIVPISLSWYWSTQYPDFGRFGDD